MSWLTIQELIDELSKFDPTLKVKTEGCDCINAAGKPEHFVDSFNRQMVLIPLDNDDDD